MQTIFDTTLPIAIGGDHAGFDYKEAIEKMLIQSGKLVEDMGTHSLDSVDYPDFAHPVAEMVSSGKAGFGILVCGSGNGVCITANKHQNVRAALCWNVELAQLARQHNNANVLCIPARFIELNMAEAMVQAFMATSFEGGRHEKRVAKI
ncbi:MAG TPA: ribose 5-phosphate isomerase B [Flavipsychrobacter sp.]|nr:ribose 5-phosphate isomerase B [Flavipsychrobacter sp.]